MGKKIFYILHVLGIRADLFSKVFHKNDMDLSRTVRFFLNPSLAIKDNAILDISRVLKNNKINMLTIADNGYPKPLKHIFDIAPILFCKGKPMDSKPKIAVVGTRDPTPYGRRSAQYFGRQLSRRGITVVSGMARGIDSVAQKAALKEKGGTIGVLGCGIGHVYPSSNGPLFSGVANKGTLVSEYMPFSSPRKKNFPRRNRIISGLCQGVIVIESDLRGGALITSDLALRQGREVFAVPGSIFNKKSRGTNRLIQQGAKAVSTIDDVLDEIRLD